jgi:hypothetical protein
MSSRRPPLLSTRRHAARRASTSSQFNFLLPVHTLAGPGSCLLSTASTAEAILLLPVHTLAGSGSHSYCSTASTVEAVFLLPSTRSSTMVDDSPCLLLDSASGGTAAGDARAGDWN